MARVGIVPAWGALVAGLASAVTMPLAIYLTRFSQRYDLVHSSFFIPLGAALGIGSILLARRARRAGALSLRTSPGVTLAGVGRVLAIVGICIALSGIVALVVYGLLEYAGTRD